MAQLQFSSSLACRAFRKSTGSMTIFSLWLRFDFR